MKLNLNTNFQSNYDVINAFSIEKELKIKNVTIKVYKTNNNTFPVFNLLGLLYCDDNLMMEKNIICFEEFKTEGINYLIENILKTYLAEKYLCTENISPFELCGIAETKEKACYLYKEEQLNKEYYKYLCNFKNYLIINNFSKFKELNGLLKQLEKFNIVAYFIKREVEFSNPVMECILINKNAYGNFFNMLNRSQEIRHRFIIVTENLEKDLINAIYKLLFGDCNYLNYEEFNCKELAKNKKIEFTPFETNFIPDKNIDISIIKNNYIKDISICVNKKQYNKDKYASYIEAIINGKEVKQIFAEKIFISYLPYRLKNDINLDILKNYLYCIGILLNNKEYLIKEKNGEYLHEGLPMSIDTYEKRNVFMSALFYYLSCAAAKQSHNEIILKLKQLFKDQNMIETLNKILNKDISLWNNEYIFNTNITREEYINGKI